MDDKIAPILLVLPAPNELRIEVGIARIADLLRRLLLFIQHRLIFGRRDILALSLVVLERLDGFCDGSLGHDYLLPVARCAVAVAIILSNSLSTLALKSDSIW